RASPLDDPATPEPYTLSLHDALPISIPRPSARWPAAAWPGWKAPRRGDAGGRAGCATGCSWALLVSVVVGGCPGVGWAGRRGWADRKSTRLNSSHVSISYAVFCLKKK